MNDADIAAIVDLLKRGVIRRVRIEYSGEGDPVVIYERTPEPEPRFELTNKGWQCEGNVFS